jgi:ATP/maltotriose-dependent transcriptional regulator MalT
MAASVPLLAVPILCTKLYIPPPPPKVVSRARLIERLNEGLHRMPGVILISARAGFGKPTLVFSPSCIDIIRGIIKVTIDKSI